MNYPPLMDMSQDIVIILRQSYKDFSDANQNELDFIRSAHFPADTIVSINPNHECLNNLRYKLFKQLFCFLDLLIEMAEDLPVEKDPLQFIKHLNLHSDGNRLGISDLCASVGKMGSAADKTMRFILDFLLHLRSKNMEIPWKQIGLLDLLEKQSSFEDYIFNEEIFILFLDNGYVAKLFKTGQETLYIELLGILLQQCKSQSLKISISRKLLHATSQSTSQKYLHALIHPLSSIFKITYLREELHAITSISLAALINLSADDEIVKEMLIQRDIAAHCVFLLKETDTDLLYSTLILTLNLTKESSHRQEFIYAGIPSVLFDLLAFYYNSPHAKVKNLLSILISVIGQLANEYPAKDAFCTNYPTLECVLYLFHSFPAGSDYKMKAAFCLKQLCQFNGPTKVRVGKHCILDLILELECVQTPEKALTILSFLQVLSTYRALCTDMQKGGIEESLQSLQMLHPTWQDVHEKASFLQAFLSKQKLYEHLLS
ncbi:hypothetical protein IE077_002337 [Cardiosporidium cionae]|uniref:Uncharacterized protein n=1 Tax=Cardiosporidium cionae TaxID=476202 RepID=A0ABQ7JB19_9APIC|nr:hypothetical protein IE077_002337 [Cardiosporidium cionae]|eukprot:KAF8821198.1 hypothetical protein IE077_002337 [Cardiosporidium cionae]